jgi:hypothetical protein
MSFSSAMGKMRTTLAWIKMAAFFNPVMMPMYNTYQLAMGGLWNPRHWNLTKSYEDIGGWKSFFGREYGTRSQDYWKAMEEGAASQPFSNPYSDIESMTKGIASQKGSPMSDWARGILNSYISRVSSDFRDSSLPMKPIAPLKAAMAMFYSGINTMTWVGDEYTRMIAYNYLRDKGHSPRDAAQISAMMLGDYASVPAKTRQLYNMILFTPTYKISMVKFWGKMLESVTNPKVVGSFIGKDPKYKTDRRYVYSVLGSAAMSGAIRAGFANMGWEEDEFLRKWTRNITTKEGRKQLVTTLSTPLNIVWKYGSLFKKIIMGDPGSIDSAFVRISRAAEMELHPLWKALIQASRNQNIGGETIIHPFDPPQEKVKHAMSFAIETLSPVVNFMYGKVNNDIPWEGKSQKLARDAYRKEAGPFMDAMLDILAFKYVRDIPEIRRSKELQRLATELPKELIREKKENGTIRRDWIENYRERSAEVVLRMRKGK